ncbi:MAG TPA: Hsp20/alpha crystallin family protein [Sphingomonas sp.]|nr:Hsp20/alpha crystallin family protein [Sphingomonas sp.]
MAMRDLMPWRGQHGSMPAPFGDERSPFAQLRREMDRMFDDLLPMSGRGQGGASGTAWPTLEVKQGENELCITAEMPGMTDKDVELTVHDGVLTLSGERKSTREDRDRGWSERYYGRFERSIALPDGADENGCTAEFHDGVLTVRMPVSQQARRGRRIPIGSGEPDTKH